MWYENNLTNMLNIKYPIIQAGMAGVTTPELVATVSNNGALGTIGAGYMSKESLRQQIKKVKKLTSKPFAVNLFTPETPSVPLEKINQTNQILQPFRDQLGITSPPTLDKISDENFKDQINVIIEEKVPICSFTFGIPDKDILHQLKLQNIKIIGTATTVREALQNEHAQMDAVVMQGSEAGGHRGTFQGDFNQALIGNMSLIPQTKNSINIPLIAAGGIMDGRGVVATLALGAQAAQMGTAFLTTDESSIIDSHKEKISVSSEEDTVLTSVFSGKPARGIRNHFIENLQPFESLLPPYPILNSLTNDIRNIAKKEKLLDYMSLWCGQSPRLSRMLSTRDLINNIVIEVEDTLNHLK